MENLDYEKTYGFWSVGMLRSLISAYPEDTPISVCGTPGLFIPDDEQRCILLETLDNECYYAGNTATDMEAYMDF